MKSSDKPQFSVKWWVSNRPPDIKGADLEKALKTAENALSEEQKKKTDRRAIDACLGAVKAVGTAATKTTKECDKKKHKDVIAVLKKFDGLAKSEIARLDETKSKLAEASGDEDDEESEGKLFEKEYVHKLIKLIKSGGKELNFAFGLDMNAPEACELLLHRKKGSEMLWKILKKTKRFPNRLMCYGTAVTDATDKQTLLFSLDAGSNIPPKKILRIGRKLFQFDKKLRFKKLKVVAPNGETFEDTEPDDEAEAADSNDKAEAGAAGGEAGDLSRERETAEKFVRAWQLALSQVSSQVGNIRKAMAPMRDQPTVAAIHDALAAYDGLDSVQREFPDLDLSKLVDAAAKNDRALYDETLRQTAKEVGQARAELNELRPLLNALDENPYGVPTNADDTVTRVLETIADRLGV